MSFTRTFGLQCHLLVMLTYTVIYSYFGLSMSFTRNVDLQCHLLVLLAFNVIYSYFGLSMSFTRTLGYIVGSAFSDLSVRTKTSMLQFLTLLQNALY